MLDDDILLDRLARALRVGPVEPAPERVRAVRRHPRAGTFTVAVGGPGAGVDGEVAGGAPVASTARSRLRPSALGPPTPTPIESRRRRRLPTRVLIVASAAAVVLGVALIAVRELPSPLGGAAHNVGLPVSSPRLVQAQDAAYRVRVALARRDPGEVARADAQLLRSANRVEGSERGRAQDLAVPVHVQAIEFLRDHPSPEALSGVPTPSVPVGGAAQAPPPAGPKGQRVPSVSVVPTTAAPAPGGSAPNDQPTTTTVAAPVVPRVSIVRVVPRLDATFEVHFETTGFTPSASHDPGSYAVRFSFDSGQDQSSYSGPSPWSFAVLDAVQHHQVCAQVVDGSGTPVPNSGGCRDILAL